MEVEGESRPWGGEVSTRVGGSDSIERPDLGQQLAQLAQGCSPLSSPPGECPANPTRQIAEHNLHITPLLCCISSSYADDTALLFATTRANWGGYTVIEKLEPTELSFFNCFGAKHDPEFSHQRPPVTSIKPICGRRRRTQNSFNYHPRKAIRQKNAERFRY